MGEGGRGERESSRERARESARECEREIVDRGLYLLYIHTPVAPDTSFAATHFARHIFLQVVCSKV